MRSLGVPSYEKPEAIVAWNIDQGGCSRSDWGDPHTAPVAVVTSLGNPGPIRQVRRRRFFLRVFWLHWHGFSGGGIL